MRRARQRKRINHILIEQSSEEESVWFEVKVYHPSVFHQWQIFSLPTRPTTYKRFTMFIMPYFIPQANTHGTPNSLNANSLDPRKTRKQQIQKILHLLLTNCDVHTEWRYKKAFVGKQTVAPFYKKITIPSHIQVRSKFYKVIKI